VFEWEQLKRSKLILPENTSNSGQNLALTALFVSITRQRHTHCFWFGGWGIGFRVWPRSTSQKPGQNLIAHDLFWQGCLAKVCSRTNPSTYVTITGWAVGVRDRRPVRAGPLVDQGHHFGAGPTTAHTLFLVQGLRRTVWSLAARRFPHTWPESYLTESVYTDVLQMSFSAQIRQPFLYYCRLDSRCSRSATLLGWTTR